MASDQADFKLVHQVGVEAYQLIVKRMEALGERPFLEIFSAVVGAATVCLASTLRPGIERAQRKDVAADQLVASSMKQVRSLLESVVKRK